MALDINALLAQLQALGSLNVQRQVANRDSVDNGGMGSGASDTFTSEALQGLLPGARLQAMQSHGYMGGDNAGFYDDPSKGYDFFYDVGGGRYLHGTTDGSGSVTGLRERRERTNLLNKIGGAALDMGPLLVLAAATAGAGGLGGLFGGAGEAAGAAGGVPISGLGASPALVPANLGAVGGAELGSGAFGLGTASGSAAIPFGGLTGAPALGTVGQIGGQMAVIPAAGAGMGGIGAAAAGALGAAQPAVAPQSAAAVPAADKATGLLTTDALRSAAPYVGPAASLLSGGLQAASLPQVPGAPVIPGAEAPPEARGYQASRAPILDVLGRNRRAGRNPTLLTGPRGVNMESVRVGGNTLLGM